MKKILWGLMCIFFMAGCGSDSFREDLYHDTSQLSAIIFVAQVIDRELDTEDLNMFKRYKEKYSDANKYEQKLIDKLLELKLYYEMYLADEKQLNSEDEHSLKLSDSFVEYYDLMGEINDKYNFYNEEDEKE